MSVSDTTSPDRAVGEILVEGPQGVSIEILNGDLDVVARGSIELQRTLPEGVYLVKWIAGDQIYQRIERLLPTAKPLHVEPPPEISARTPEQSEIHRVSRELTNAEKPISAWRRRQGSDVVVLVRKAAPDLKSDDLGRSVRLYNSREVRMRSDPQAVRVERQLKGDDWAAAVYHVSPGSYRIRYQSLRGRSVEQMVPALDRRRTVVVLEFGIGVTLSPGRVGGKSGYRRISQPGATPAATRIVSLPFGETVAHRADDIRLSDLVRHALDTGETALDWKTALALKESSSDPLLKLYAAALILQRLSNDLPPSLDADDEQASSAAPTFNAWLDLAADLVLAADPDWKLADGVVCGWRLALMGRQWSRPPPVEILEPPSLFCCWQWAVAQSALEPSALPDRPTFRAAALGRVPAAAWLAWGVAASKAGEVQIEPALTETVQGAAERLAVAAEKLGATVRTGSLSGSRRATSAEGPRTTLLSTLSPETRRAVASVRRFVNEPTAGADPMQALTQALDSPASLIIQELDTARREIQAASLPATLQGDPPALMRRIRTLDDPNKNRFGGSAKRDGFELRARFGQLGRSWVQVRLTVVAGEDAGPLRGLTVQFFLHDSFRPNRVVRNFLGKRAELLVNAWGGFTVGAWIPKRRIELELDLSEDPRAPAIIREY